MDQQNENSQKDNLNILEKLKDIIDEGWNSPEASYDEVYPNLLLGDEYIAKDVELLRREKVTHILNAAQGKEFTMYVDTNEDYYKNLNYPCKFLGIPAADVTAYQLHHYFSIATDFIDDGLKNSSQNGKVLIHCLQGVSRSATLVIAYLMMNKGIPILEATKLVRDKRCIYPNEGFLQQLCDLDISIRKGHTC